MSKKYDLLVYVGRFQPFHNGHAETILEAVKLAERVLVLVGSANRAPCPKNPFLNRDVVRNISTWVDHIPKTFGMVTVQPLDDYTDDSDWANAVSMAATREAALHLPAGKYLSDAKIAIIGHEKDASSYYLNILSQVGLEHEPLPLFCDGLSSTKIRAAIYESDASVDISSLVPKHSLSLRQIDSLKSNSFFYHLHKWNKVEEDIKKAWAFAPYPVSFNAGDAMVIVDNKVLLAARQSSVGYGQLALPGGYLEVGSRETTLETAMRELIEETRINVSIQTLRACELRDMRLTVDDPKRSNRGRIISHVHVFDLTKYADQLRVRPTNECRPEFVSFREVREVIAPEFYFEDHRDILLTQLDRLKNRRA